MQNPKALKFNICKKLSQLMKVIQLFETQICEREFQINFLKSTIDPQINEYLDDYKNKMENYNNGIGKERDELLQKIDKLYNRKYETLKSDSSAYIDAATENMGKFQEKILVDIEDLKKQIAKILNSLQNKMTAVESHCESTKKQLGQNIEKIKVTYKKELESHDKESNKRIETLKKESQDKIKKLRDDQKIEIKKVRDSFGGATIPPEMNDKCHKMKIALKHLNDQLKSTRENVKQLINSRQQQSKANRNKLADVCHAMRKLLDSHKSNLQSLEQDMKDEKENQIKLIEKLKHDVETQDIAHELDINKANKIKEEELNRMQQELEEANLKYKQTFETFDEEAKHLIEEHQKELQKVGAVHKKSADDTEIRLQKKHQEILLVSEEHMKELAKIQEQLKQAMNKHNEDISEVEKKHNKEIEEENEIFSSESKNIQKQIDDILAGGSAESQKNKEMLQQMRDQKTKIINDYTEMISNVDNKYSKEKVELEESNKKELELIKTQNSNDVQSFTINNDKEYNVLQKQLDDEYAAMQEKEKSIYNEEIEEVQKVGSDKSKLERLIAEYKSKLAGKQNELSSIQAPDMNKMEDFQKFDKMIEELEKQKVDLSGIIDMQKTSLENEWKNKFDTENDRHSQKVVRSSMGTEKEQKRLAYLQEIANTKHTHVEEESKLKDIINKWTSDHKANMKELREHLEKSKATDKIDELNEQIEKLNQSKLSSISDIDQKEKESEERFKEKKENENSAHKQKIKDVRNQIEECDKKFALLKEKIEKSIEDSKLSFEEAFTNYCTNSEKKVQTLADRHQDNLNILANENNTLKDQYSKSSASFNIKVKNNSSQYQSLLDEFERNSKAEATKRQSDWYEMRTFYEDKITNLSKKREEAIERFESRLPRQSEVDIIERLQNNLRLKTSQLQSLVQEFTEYRSMYVKQEKEYNQRFGKGPKVGVLAVANPKQHP